MKILLLTTSILILCKSEHELVESPLTTSVFCVNNEIESPCHYYAVFINDNMLVSVNFQKHYISKHLGIRSCKPLNDVNGLIKYKLAEITYCRLSISHYHYNNKLMAIRMNDEFETKAKEGEYAPADIDYEFDVTKRQNVFVHAQFMDQKTSDPHYIFNFTILHTEDCQIIRRRAINPHQGCGFLTDHQDNLDPEKPEHKVRILRGAPIIGHNHKLLGIVGPRYNCTSCNIFEVISLHQYQWYLMAQNDLQESGLHQHQLCSDDLLLGNPEPKRYRTDEL